MSRSRAQACEATKGKLQVGTVNRVIFDTDIGTDVDDALALGVLLGAENVELVAVTTVYGDTALRARLAKRYAALAGRPLTVHVGEGETLSGKEVWWAGHEGTLHEDLERETVETESAVDLIVRLVQEHPGELDIVAVGPLTNIAAAILRDEAFASGVKHLWIMGGCFTGESTEHNFRSDITAAGIVFGSGIPMTVAGLEVTQRIEMTAVELDEIAASGALGAALERDIHQWWEFWNETWNVPHDPVTVLTMLRPELFTYSEPGTVTIAADDGASTFTVDPIGSTRIVSDLDPRAVSSEIVAGIVRAQLP